MAGVEFLVRHRSLKKCKVKLESNLEMKVKHWMHLFDQLIRLALHFRPTIDLKQSGYADLSVIL